MPAVHYRYSYDTHYAPVASLACLTSLITGVLAVVVTLLFVWNTRNLWVLRSEFFEQPKVLFRKEFLFEVETAAGAFVYSNIPAVASVVAPSRARVGLFSVEETDSNDDGVTDEFRFRVRFPAEDVKGFTSVRGALFFSFGMDARFRLAAQAMATFEAASPIPGGGVTFVGDLRFDQSGMLIPDRDTVTQFNVPIIDTSAQALAPSSIDFAVFAREYYLRNVTLRYNTAPHVWSRYSGDGFTVDATVTVPRQLVAYRPAFWESIKFAWIQLVCVFVIAFLIRGCVHECIFGGRLVATRIVPDPNHKQHNF
eukprot:Amastigsp_a842309_38.p2 type:complete len:310 gc:universal Amastigsp_a842309_38:103-1032(+)